jgi:hypothetical protein
MRTTITIEDGLLQRARQVSHATGKSLGEVVEDALRMALATRRKQPGPLRFKPLKTFRGSGTLPGVDLNSSSALLETMDQP